MPIKHKIRIDGDGGTRTAKLTPSGAIKAHCRECYGFCAHVAQEVRDCPSELCALWPFRTGKAHSGRIIPTALTQSVKNRANSAKQKGGHTL